MPAMIQTCPGCGRRGILSKQTGTCVHCKRGGATKVKVTKTAAAVTITSSTAPPAATSKRASTPSTGARLYKGRLVR